MTTQEERQQLKLKQFTQKISILKKYNPKMFQKLNFQKNSEEYFITNDFKEIKKKNDLNKNCQFSHFF